MEFSCVRVCVCVKFSRIEKTMQHPMNLMMSHSGSQLCQSWFAFNSQGPLLQWIPVTMPQLQVLLPSLNAQLSQGLQPSHGKFAELPHTCASVTKCDCTSRTTQWYISHIPPNLWDLQIFNFRRELVSQGFAGKELSHAQWTPRLIFAKPPILICPSLIRPSLANDTTCYCYGYCHIAKK